MLSWSLSSRAGEMVSLSTPLRYLISSVFLKEAPMIIVLMMGAIVVEDICHKDYSRIFYWVIVSLVVLFLVPIEDSANEGRDEE